jgi:hypothetical protein
MNGTPNEFTTFNGVAVPKSRTSFLWYEFWGSDKTFPHFAALGLGLRHAVQVGEAGALALRRHGAGHGDLLARPHRRRRAASAASSTTSSTSCRPSSKPPASRARDDQRHQAAPIDGVSMAYTWDKANANAPTKRHDAVLRDARQPRHLPRRLGCGDDAGDAALGAQHQAAARRDHRLQVGALQRDGGSYAVQRPRGEDAPTSSSRCRTSSIWRRTSMTCCRSTTRRWRAGTRRSRA